MNIKWYEPSLGTSIVTIASYGISLNKAATKELGNAFYVRFGFDEDENIIVIQPLTSNEENAIELTENKNGDQMRINKKDLVRSIKQFFNIDLEKALRVPCHWSKESEVLVLDLNKSEKIG